MKPSTFSNCAATLFLAVIFLIAACGVKKPPTPAYAFPMDRDSGLAPSPTPGFNHPSGPISEPNP